MKILLPEGCIKSDVCKFVGDNGCFMGCDFRLEVAQNSTSNNTAHSAIALLDVRKVLESGSAFFTVSVDTIMAEMEKIAQQQNA